MGACNREIANKAKHSISGESFLAFWLTETKLERKGSTVEVNRPNAGSPHRSVGATGVQKHYKRRKDLDALLPQRGRPSNGQPADTGLHFGDSCAAGLKYLPDERVAISSSEEDALLTKSLNDIAFSNTLAASPSKHISYAKGVTPADGDRPVSRASLLKQAMSGIYSRMRPARRLPAASSTQLSRPGSCTNARFFAVSSLILAVLVCLSVVLGSTSLWLFFTQKAELDAIRAAIRDAHAINQHQHGPSAIELEAKVLALATRVETVETRLAALNITLLRGEHEHVPLRTRLDEIDSRLQGIERRVASASATRNGSLKNDAVNFNTVATTTKHPPSADQDKRPPVGKL